MSIDFRRTQIRFDSTRGREQSEPAAVVFRSRVQKADVAINGFNVGFTDGDHHVWRHKIDARIERVVDETVFVRVNYLLRDSSGNIDDRYDGTVDVLVFADVA